MKIKNEVEYNAALRRIEEIFFAEPGTPDGDELVTLVAAVEEYEQETCPMPTHLVSFYGVRCYMNDDTGAMWGVNKVHDWLIPVAAWLHNLFAMVVPGAGANGFPLRILKTFSAEDVG